MSVVLHLKSDKKIGTQGQCPNCHSQIRCEMSRYQGGYENKPQWQNMDGSAHLKWLGGGNFQCVKQKEETTDSEEPQNQDLESMNWNEISDIEETDVSGNEIHVTEKFDNNETITLETLNEKLDCLKEMIAPIFQWVVDHQLKEGKQSS